MHAYAFAILCCAAATAAGTAQRAPGAALAETDAEAEAVSAAESPMTFSSDGAGSHHHHQSNSNNNNSIAMWNRLRTTVHTVLGENMRQNSRKLKLDDFSWGIFSGSRGRMLGLRDYTLAQQRSQANRWRLNMAFGLTVPALQAVWEKSVCMGYACAMTIELRDCEFAVRVSLDARADCAIEHSAQLLRYSDAACRANYQRSSPIAVALVEATARLLGHALNTRPFAKIVAENVNRALLRLPLFNGTDVRTICDDHRLVFS